VRGPTILHLFIKNLVKQFFMAELDRNSPLQGLRGRIGTIIFKWYPQLNNGHGKTVASKVPEMGGIKPSELQKMRRSVFAEAVAYARLASRHPEKRAAWEKVRKPGQSVFNAALSSYLKKQKDEMNSKEGD
jgi:hypothetical protein